MKTSTATLPNFLLIGAAKCGTDSLAAYLGQHPAVFMCPNREPNYFVAQGQATIPYRGPGDQEVISDWDMWVNTRARYEALFSDVSGETAIGEGTTWYLYDEQVPERIRRELPQAKLIAILRNPADRAYSAFTMMLRDGRETTQDFAAALAAEDERVRASWEPLWHYRRMGFYASQLKRYYATFDPTQLHVVLHDDFNARPGEVLRDLFRFLEVDETFEPDTSARFNTSMVPRHLTYHRLIAGQNPLKSLVKSVLPSDLRHRVKETLTAGQMSKPAPLAPQIRAQLVETFRPDILELQDLLHRDLSAWLR